MDRDRENVPASACQFTADVDVSDANGKKADTYPFSMTARRGNAIDHPYWGRIVHDLEGMHLARGRVSVDLDHDPKRVVGYANRFDVSTGDLKVSGALVPYGDDAAKELLYKASKGVPYEASISFGGSNIELEQVEEGESVEVNNTTFDGPGVVVRSWPLRSIGIVQSGADQWTATEFSAETEDSISVTWTEKKEAGNMANENATPAETEMELANNANENAGAVEAVEAVDTAPDLHTEESEADASKVAASDVDTELTNRRSEGQRWLDVFGEAGARYFALGMSWDEATQQHIKDQESVIADLRAKLSGVGSGEPAPVSFVAENSETEKYRPFKDVAKLL